MRIAAQSPALTAEDQASRLRQAADRFRSVSGFDAGLVLVATYAALRVLAAPDLIVDVWIGAAVVATLVWPLAGLTVLAAIGPFTEALTSDGRITAVPYLLVAIGLSVVARVGVARPLPRPPFPVVAAIVILAGTALSVVHSWITFGSELGRQALELWVPSLGGAMTVLIAAAFLASRGETRPFVVAAASTSIAAALAVLDLLSRGAVDSSPLGWLLRGFDPNRLVGIIPAPNAAAAIFVVALAVCLAGAAFVHDRRVRVLAAVGTGIGLLAVGLTYSRSGLLAVGVVVALIAWARWRRVGLVVAVACLVVGVGLSLLVGLLREVPAVYDLDRLSAWEASIRMWQAHLVFGSGFRSFEWVHAVFGSPVLDAPHNEWLRLLAEEGTFVGLAGIAFAILTPIVLMRRAGVLFAGAGAAAAGLFVMAFFNNPFLYTQVNVPAFVIIGTGLGLAVRRGRKDDQLT
jgi:hypothetical protein